MFRKRKKKKILEEENIHTDKIPARRTSVLINGK